MGPKGQSFQHVAPGRAQRFVRCRETRSRWWQQLRESRVREMAQPSGTIDVSTVLCVPKIVSAKELSVLHGAVHCDF